MNYLLSPKNDHLVLIESVVQNNPPHRGVNMKVYLESRGCVGRMGVQIERRVYGREMMRVMCVVV